MTQRILALGLVAAAVALASCGQSPSTTAPATGAPPVFTGGGRGVQPPPHTPAYWIKITAQPDGSFTVSNSRNGYSKTYAARPRGR